MDEYKLKFVTESRAEAKEDDNEGLGTSPDDNGAGDWIWYRLKSLWNVVQAVTTKIFSRQEK